MNHAMLWYYGFTVNTLTEAVKYMLHVAVNEMECDSFGMQTIMDNHPEDFIEEMKFLPGGGCMHHYLFNWSIGK